MERFCPTIHGICRDGYADNNEVVCCFWDSVEEQCLFVSSAVASLEFYKMRKDLLNNPLDLNELKKQAHRDSGIPDETSE